MKKIIQLLIIITIVSIPLYAITAFDISEAGISAESIALGGTHGTVYTSNAIFSNPALLHPQLAWSLDGFRSNPIENVVIHNFSALKKIKNNPVALGYIGTGTSFPKTDQTNENVIIKIGDYHYALHTYYMGVQHQLTNSISSGFAAKITKMKLGDYSAKGFNSDIGFAWVKKKHHFSVVIQNILWFQKQKYSNNTTENFPLKIILNGSKKHRLKKLIMQSHLQAYYNQNQQFLYGLGLQLQSVTLPYLEGLVGYRTRPHLNSSIARYTIGFNLNLNNFKLSYAYEKSQTPIYNNIHYISIHLFKQE